MVGRLLCWGWCGAVLGVMRCTVLCRPMLSRKRYFRYRVCATGVVMVHDGQVREEYPRKRDKKETGCGESAAMV